jgi:hypothetical protein
MSEQNVVVSLKTDVKLGKIVSILPCSVNRKFMCVSYLPKLTKYTNTLTKTFTFKEHIPSVDDDLDLDPFQLLKTDKI